MKQTHEEREVRSIITLICDECGKQLGGEIHQQYEPDGESYVYCIECLVKAEAEGEHGQ